MLTRNIVLWVLLATMALAGCGSKALPVAPGPVDDLRDAIAIAIEDGDEAEVRKLLETQPLLLNAPIPNWNNYTALHCAARAGNAAIATLLLEQGADPYIMDDEGQKPHDVAVAMGVGQGVIDLLWVQ